MLSKAQNSIPLYSGKIPNSLKAEGEEKQDPKNTSIQFLIKISRPTLTIYLPPKEIANGAAIVICPGGGYGGVAIDHEGFKIAEEFNKIGVAAFVLKYRMPDNKAMPDKTIGPLQDAQQAIKTVRERAKEWNINPGKLGIIGFSAGGHLASTAATHYNQQVLENKANVNLRPDFQILIYPVISFADSLTHSGSRDNLIGRNAGKEKVDLYSNELQVTKETPPAFLVHAQDDEVVKVENSLRYYESLHRNKIPAELIIYPKGGHGFGLNNTTTPDKWFDHCKNWMAAMGWLKK